MQIIWRSKIVDAIFRGGKKHSNYGNAVVNIVTGLVKTIRKEYSETVTIILRRDSGFFDQKNLLAFDKLEIGFICTGKMYKGVKEHIVAQTEREWKKYNNGHKEWEYMEFGYRCESWNKFYRAIYTRVSSDEKQRLLDFARPDNVIVTNIGVNPTVLTNCSAREKCVHIWYNFIKCHLSESEAL